jgi:hypothetical protein
LPRFFYLDLTIVLNMKQWHEMTQNGTDGTGGKAGNGGARAFRKAWRGSRKSRKLSNAGNDPKRGNPRGAYVSRGSFLF